MPSTPFTPLTPPISSKRDRVLSAEEPAAIWRAGREAARRQGFFSSATWFWSVRVVFGRRDIHERWAVSFANQKILAGPSDQPKQKGSAEGRHIDNPPIIRMGPVLEDEHARDQGDRRQPTTKPVPEVSQFSRHRSLTAANS